MCPAALGASAADLAQSGFDADGSHGSLANWRVRNAAAAASENSPELRAGGAAELGRASSHSADGNALAMQSGWRGRQSWRRGLAQEVQPGSPLSVTVIPTDKVATCVSISGIRQFSGMYYNNRLKPPYDVGDVPGWQGASPACSTGRKQRQKWTR